MGTDPPARPLAVTGAAFDAERVGLRCEDGAEEIVARAAERARRLGSG